MGIKHRTERLGNKPPSHCLDHGGLPCAYTYLLGKLLTGKICPYIKDRFKIIKTISRFLTTFAVNFPSIFLRQKINDFAILEGEIFEDRCFLGNGTAVKSNQMTVALSQ